MTFEAGIDVVEKPDAGHQVISRGLLGVLLDYPFAYTPDEGIAIQKEFTSLVGYIQIESRRENPAVDFIVKWG